VLKPFDSLENVVAEKVEAFPRRLWLAGRALSAPEFWNGVLRRFAGALRVAEDLLDRLRSVV
jgi:hypothetical protein